MNSFKKMVAMQSPVVDYKTGCNSLFFSVFVPLGDMTLLLLSWTGSLSKPFSLSCACELLWPTKQTEVMMCQFRTSASFGTLPGCMSVSPGWRRRDWLWVILAEITRDHPNPSQRSKSEPSRDQKVAAQSDDLQNHEVDKCWLFSASKIGVVG